MEQTLQEECARLLAQMMQNVVAKGAPDRGVVAEEGDNEGVDIT